MRLTDYLALAGHSLHRGIDTACVLFMAAAVTVLCFSGAILTAIHSEKAEPCELAVTAPSYLAITEQSVQDFRAIADVVDAAGFVEVPVTVASGKYAASLTLVGIDGDYLRDLTYVTGEPFPESGAMPWIVLSKSAAQSFIDPEDKTKHGTDYMPDIDWLDADFSLQFGDGTVSAKVSGLFEGDEPAAYIRQDVARALLQGQGLPSGYTGTRVRTTNIGAAEAVSEAITSQGYEVANRDSARQEKWDTQTREAVYLAILAAAGFLCTGMVRLTGAALHREEKRRQTDALCWAGVSESAIRGIGVLRSIHLAFIGTVLGIAVHYLVAALAALGDTTTIIALKLPMVWLLLPLCTSVGVSSIFFETTT